MRSYFGQTVTLTADFGPSNAGLSTVGYKLLNGDATTFQERTTTNVAETATGTGEYKVQLASNVFSAAFDGYVLWDNGASSPVYATEDLQMVAAPPVGTDYTSARATKLDNLDATISGVAASVWTVLTSTLTTTGSIGKLLTTNIDAAVSGVAASVWATVTSGLTTVGSIGKLLVTNVDAAVSTRSSHSVADIWNALTSGLTTAGSVGKWIVDKIDVVVSTRLASSDYTAPDNTDIAAIKLKTDLIPAAGPADAAHYTNARGDKLDNLDAAVSGVPASTATLVWAAVTRSLTDKAGFSLSTGGIQAIWDALTSALTTTGSIGKWLVDKLDAAVSSRSTYAGSDTPGTTTLLARITATRAGLLDNLDAAISTRLAASAYTAPDNTTIAEIFAAVDTEEADIVAAVAAIKAKTDNLPVDPADASDIAGAFTAVNAAIAALGTPAQDDALATAQAAIDALGSPVQIDDIRLDHLDADVSTRLASDDYTAPDNAGIAALGSPLQSDDPRVDNLDGLANLSNLDAPVSSRATPADVTGEIVADLTPITDQLDLIQAQTDRIGSANVRLTSPVAAKSSVTLDQGDDYSALDGRSLEWHNTDGGWPDLTEHDVFFVIADSIQVDAEALDASTVRVELSAEDTSAIPQGSHEYEIYAHISDRKITLVRATVTVREVIHDAEGD